MLLNQPPNDLERAHSVRVGFGAGVEPGLHVLFEERFGFPLVEVWGMTEMVRVLADNHEPRQRGSTPWADRKLGWKSAWSTTMTKKCLRTRLGK